MPAGRTPYVFRPWEHIDREHICTDILEANRIHTVTMLGYADYEDKYNRRYDSLDSMPRSI